jgi:16S rRNA processing protein RimM
VTSNRQRKAAQRKQSASDQRISTADNLKFVAVARLRRAHGLKGEVLAEVVTDFPDRLIPEAIFLFGVEKNPMTIKAVRSHNDGLLLTFEGVGRRDFWQGKQNQYLYSSIDDLPELQENEFYEHEIIGLEVVDLDGKNWGKVSEILQTGANDVYAIVDINGAERLIPATTEVIKEIDISQNLIRIELIAGIFDN